MNQNFDRAPGAGRSYSLAADPGFVGAGDDDANKPPLFDRRGPLRQPRSMPLYAESNISPTSEAVGGDCRRQTRPQTSPNANNVSASCYDVDSLVRSSTLSASAAEFVPSGFNSYEDPTLYDDNEEYYTEINLEGMVKDFLDHLSSSPGTFESDIDYITGMLNSCVTTEALLQDLVELIYKESTAIPNFSYTGARLCNHLSKHLNVSPPSGNFRQLLLKRCRTEYEHRDVAVRGEAGTQKKFHSFVLFLGELYLSLELKSAKGPPKRAEILLVALKDLMHSLFSNPVDSNLICAVKLLKLTGSILDDTWKASGQPHMDELIQRIETIVLDATCSRDVRQMLLKLVELRSSDWGRVRAVSAASNATPDNDPNYFMNEPTFYTQDGTPFTAADPDYAEKYQEILDRQEYFDSFGENENEIENEISDYEDEMEPEMEEAFERFCLETEQKRKLTQKK
ncbi:polyadenylate-binding protein-interacting protein 1 [Pleuronectes platessa]|uniref:polyadenylate-binding protein-interacting protein 1 n=1 Tax=Pleuronectes platessa TaxID=8262 RepID=UPI00232A3481|nr:polyadenylate-binding protein-interacting protein 1 [Pleuronectes platessa]